MGQGLEFWQGSGICLLLPKLGCVLSTWKSRGCTYLTGACRRLMVSSCSLPHHPSSCMPITPCHAMPEHAPSWACWPGHSLFCNCSPGCCGTGYEDRVGRPALLFALPPMAWGNPMQKAEMGRCCRDGARSPERGGWGWRGGGRSVVAGGLAIITCFPGLRCKRVFSCPRASAVSKGLRRPSAAPL